MKKNILRRLLMLTMFTLYGLVIQCLLFTALLAKEGVAQAISLKEVRIDIQLNRVSLDKALKAIEAQTGLSFVYPTEEINLDREVSIHAKHETVFNILLEISKRAKVSFKQVNNNISVQQLDEKEYKDPKKSVILQTITITGKVTADDGSGLPGVNVIEKNTTNGTVTDIHGAYSIQVPRGAVLVFSFVGYRAVEVPVENQSVIDVSLDPDVRELQELVVVGYGTQREGSLTGSVSWLSSEKLETKPVVSVESALQGQMPGVSVVNNGSPGTSPTVRIRGIGSVNYAADPLYVVDGVPVGNLNNFDVKDIESVSVLKDAASAAIYGSRAANGVVIITTKSGQKDRKSALTFDISYGVQQAWKKLDLLNTEEYLQYGTQLLANAVTKGKVLELPYRFTHMDEPIWEGATQTFAQTNTDWQDEVFRTAPIVQLNVNYAGGNEKSSFYTSYGRFSQEGIMLGTDYDRHSIRLNTDHKVGKFLSIGENIKVSYSEMLRQRVSGGRTLIKHIVNSAPFTPVYNPKNIHGGFGGAEPTDGSDAENPVRISKLEKDQVDIVNLLGNVYAEFHFTDWLSFRSSLGVEYTSDRNTIRLPIFDEGYNERTRNELTDNRFTYYSPVITNQINLDKSINKHNVNLVLVAEQQEKKIIRLNGSGIHHYNVINVLEGSESQRVTSNKGVNVLQSYAGRFNYAFDDKYLLSLSLRRDGSSVFAPGKKTGYFPGGSLGWVVSRESFMKNVAFISNLKLRGSYGSLGFNGLEDYPWQTTISTNTAAIFGNEAQLGAYFDRIPNKDLEWEITKMTNVGFDLALLDNSITLSADFFTRQTDNLIVDNPLPTSLGYSVNPPTNIGSMKNWGYEFTAGFNKAFGDLQFGVEGNISFVRNKVLRLSKDEPFIERGAVTGDYGNQSITRTEQGKPIQGFYGWVVDGIFQSNAEAQSAPRQQLPVNMDEYDPAIHTAAGDIRFKDLDGNGVIDGNDRTFLGSFLPDFSYGFNFNAAYKGFTASMLLQGVQGNEIYNGTKVLTQGMLRLFNAEKAVLNAWTPENTNTNIPRAVSGDPNLNSRTSDRFVEDGSYMRIKNLTIGYDLPKSSLTSVFNGAISELNIYIAAQNLLTFTKYSGYDPEIGASSAYSGTNANLLQGVDFGFYPQPRTISFGVKASF